jgi:hypothetical protein
MLIVHPKANDLSMKSCILNRHDVLHPQGILIIVQRALQVVYRC